MAKGQGIHEKKKKKKMNNVERLMIHTSPDDFVKPTGDKNAFIRRRIVAL